MSVLHISILFHLFHLTISAAPECYSHTDLLDKDFMDQSDLYYVAWSSADLDRSGNWKVFKSDSYGTAVSRESYEYSTTSASVAPGNLMLLKNLEINIVYFERGSILRNAYYPKHESSMTTMQGRMRSISDKTRELAIEINDDNFDLRSHVLPHTRPNIPGNYPIIFYDGFCQYVSLQYHEQSSICTTIIVNSSPFTTCHRKDVVQNYCMVDSLTGTESEGKRMEVKVAGQRRQTEEFHALFGCNAYKQVTLEKPKKVNDGVVTHQLHIYLLQENGKGRNVAACFDMPPNHMYGILFVKSWMNSTGTKCIEFNVEEGGFFSKFLNSIVSFCITPLMLVSVIVLDVILTVIMIVIIIIERAGSGRKRHGVTRGRGRKRHRGSATEVTSSTYAPPTSGTYAPTSATYASTTYAPTSGKISDTGDRRERRHRS